MNKPKEFNSADFKTLEDYKDFDEYEAKLKKMFEDVANIFLKVEHFNGRYYLTGLKYLSDRKKKKIARWIRKVMKKHDAEVDIEIHTFIVSENEIEKIPIDYNQIIFNAYIEYYYKYNDLLKRLRSPSVRKKY